MSTEARKAVRVLPELLAWSSCGREVLTSSACASPGALPALIHPTAREKSSCVCDWSVSACCCAQGAVRGDGPGAAASRRDSDHAGSSVKKPYLA